MKIKRLLLLTFLMLLPFNVNAFDLKCDSGTHEYGEPFACYVDGVNTNTNYDEISGTLTLPDELSCNIDKLDSGLTNSSKEALEFDLSGTTASTKPISFTCRVNKKLSDATQVQITIPDFTTHVKGSDSDGVSEILRSNLITANKYTESTTTRVTKSRDVSNGYSLLSDVSVDKKVTNDEGNTFKFSKYITEYNNLQVTYDIKEITLTYTKNAAGATVVPSSDTNKIEVSDNTVYTELAIGVNSIDLEVTSEDGTAVTVYTFNIERLDKGEGLYNKNKDATLSKLELSGYKIDFKSNVYSYVITVDSDVTTVAVNAVSTVDGASIVVYNNTNIKNGSVITIKVTALDGETEQVYTVKVKKKLDLGMVMQIVLFTIGGIAILALIMFLIKQMNKRNKDDPIYKLKQKRKIQNKGAALDTSVIPTVEQSNVQPVSPAPVAPVEMPQPVTPQVVTPVQPVTPAPVQPVQSAPVQPVQAAPAPVEMPQPVNPQAVNNNINNGSNSQ